MSVITMKQLLEAEFTLVIKPAGGIQDGYPYLYGAQWDLYY